MDNYLERSQQEISEELLDEKRAAKAREREDKLANDIQSTLSQLGQRVDQKAKQDRRTRPSKPNGFWKNRPQKQETPQEREQAVGTNFAELQDFLGRSPDESEQQRGPATQDLYVEGLGRQQERDQPQPEQMFKFVLTGNSGVGKSCLLTRYAQNAFNDDYVETVGVDFKFKTINLEGQTVKLQLWDTAGQKQAHGIMIVYDVTNRDSFEQVSQWIEDIDKHGNKTVAKLLVGNKCDQMSRRQVSMDEGEQLAKSHDIPFIETSAKNNICVEDAFMQLAAQIKKSFDLPQDRKATANRTSQNQSHSSSPIVEAANMDGLRRREWVEDESNELPEEEIDEQDQDEVLALNRERDESMEFDDPEAEEDGQLTVNLSNLVGDGSSDGRRIKNEGSPGEARASRRSSKRDSLKASEILAQQKDNTLFEFFSSLDYKPNQNQGTLRASYKSGRQQYNLYAIPGQKEGEKGQVWVQSQEGFDNDLPAVRLSDRERNHLMENFQELDRLTTNSEKYDEDIKEKKSVPLYEKLGAYKGKANVIGKYGKSPTPGREKHNRNLNNIAKNNKTFWSSGIENSINAPPKSIGEKKKKRADSPKKEPLYKQLGRPTVDITPDEKKQIFQMQFDQYMNTQKIPGKIDDSKDSLLSKKPSFMNIVYNGVSSVLGGFGGFNQSTNTSFNEVNSNSSVSQTPPPITELPPEMISQQSSTRPKHNRFRREKSVEKARELQNQHQDNNNKPIEVFQKQAQREADDFQIQAEQLRRIPKKEPIVMKFTQEDFQPKKQDISQLELDYERMQNESLMQLEEPQPEVANQQPQKHQQIQKRKKKKFEDEDDDFDPFINTDTQDDGLNLPNVIILVSDNVKLIRMNALPMLQVQVEIIQNAMSYDNDMCQLGLNDVIYVVPEFTPNQYDITYAKTQTGNEFEEFESFFEHYERFDIKNKLHENDNYGIPNRMKHLNKNCMTAIERDYYEPDLRGKAFINIKGIPNGHYTIYYLRIGQPISINSRLKVMGKAPNIYVNINRDKISDCKKPQLDFNHSSSRISKREKNKFKIMKAKNAKNRDNKIISLNSDNDSDSEEETPKEDQIEEDFKRMFSKPGSSSGETNNTRDNTPPGADDLEMEFDGDSKETPQPPPLQDSKEYYNSTQRMSAAMIKNPQFQIFPIDEEESMRTSMKTIQEDSERGSLQSIQQINNQVQGGQLLPDEEPDRSQSVTPISQPDQTPQPIEKIEQMYNAVTPNVGTPPFDAPEDEYRNLHREDPDKSMHSAKSMSNDEIARQIENYQMESLMALQQQSQQNTEKSRRDTEKSKRSRSRSQHGSNERSRKSESAPIMKFEEENPTFKNDNNRESLRKSGPKEIQIIQVQNNRMQRRSRSRGPDYHNDENSEQIFKQSAKLRSSSRDSVDSQGRQRPWKGNRGGSRKRSLSNPNMRNQEQPMPMSLINRQSEKERHKQEEEIQRPKSVASNLSRGRDNSRNRFFMVQQRSRSRSATKENEQFQGDRRTTRHEDLRDTAQYMPKQFVSKQQFENENFSDENDSPIRPVDGVATNNLTLKQINKMGRGMKSKPQQPAKIPPDLRNLRRDPNRRPGPGRMGPGGPMGPSKPGSSAQQPMQPYQGIHSQRQ